MVKLNEYISFPFLNKWHLLAHDILTETHIGMCDEIAFHLVHCLCIQPDDNVPKDNQSLIFNLLYCAKEKSKLNVEIVSPFSCIL